jgi:Skp family chaperone for outer membrane proteins
MTHSTAWFRGLVVATIATLILFSLNASGQGDKPQTQFGVVDLQVVSSKSKMSNDLEQQLRAMQEKFRGRLERRQNNPLLTEDEMKQFDELSEKDAPNDADKKKKDELEKKSKSLLEEYQGLQNKKEPTAADKTRIEELTKLGRDNQDKLKTLDEKLGNDFQQFRVTKNEEFKKQIKASVAKVADQKKISIVFDSAVALYAGTDLTEAVVKEMDKK